VSEVPASLRTRFALTCAASEQERCRRISTSSTICCAVPPSAFQILRSGGIELHSTLSDDMLFNCTFPENLSCWVHIGLHSLHMSSHITSIYSWEVVNACQRAFRSPSVPEAIGKIVILIYLFLCHKFSVNTNLRGVLWSVARISIRIYLLVIWPLNSNLCTTSRVLQFVWWQMFDMEGNTLLA